MDWDNVKRNVMQKMSNPVEIDENTVEFDLKAFHPVKMDIIEKRVIMRRTELPKVLLESAKENPDILDFHNKLVFEEKVKAKKPCEHCDGKGYIEKEELKNITGEVVKLIHAQEAFA